MLKFSLILATVGRSEEVAKFLAHLDLQTYRHFELIVVDQNKDDRVSRQLDSYRDKFEIVYLQSHPGLSVARNLGLSVVAGDIVAFPDDDCWYPPDVLETIASIFSCYDVDIITGQSKDEYGRDSQRYWSVKPKLCDRYNIWQLAISYTVFMKRYCVSSIGAFDESLGVGAASPWQSGEETDYLIRAIVQGYRVGYFPELFVYHPQKTNRYDSTTVVRARVYGAGMGRVMSKHMYRARFVGYMLFRPLVGAIISFLALRFKKSSYHLAVLYGRFSGWNSVE